MGHSIMSENMYNSQHKAATDKSRDGYSAMAWNTKKICWRCNGQVYILRQGTTEDYNVVCPECG